MYGGSYAGYILILGARPRVSLRWAYNIIRHVGQSINLYIKEETLHGKA